jgi:hypothetical protein
MNNFDKLISELRSAIAIPNYATIVELLADAPAERVNDLTAFYPNTKKVLTVLEMIHAGEPLDAAARLAYRSGPRSLDRLPDGFAPVLGDKIHTMLLAPPAEGDLSASLVLDFVNDDIVMCLTDDERPFRGWDDDGFWERGLSEIWSQLKAVIYDSEAVGGRDEARAYVSREQAHEIMLSGQKVSPVNYPLIDSDNHIKVCVLPTLNGWKMWVR